MKPCPTVRDAISGLPPIDGRKVPPPDGKKYTWVKNTPEGGTAFNNQCSNPDCLFQGNRRHGSSKVDGINQPSDATPLYCERCGALLPRSYVEDKDGTKRLMKGFVSAYKRMKWDEPASTITQNF